MHSVIYKQYFVKLYIKPFITLFGIILLTFSTLSTFAAKDTDSLKKIVTEFGAGVNISHFEQYWKSPEEIYKTDINEKIKTIADKGFKTIRLPVSFDLFLQPNSNYIQNDLIKRLKDILILTYGLQIKLIITYHYGKLNENNCETGEVDRIVDMWKQIQFVFKGNAYKDLFFDLYNEPTLPADKWKIAISKMVADLRAEDSQRIYIVGGTDYNSENELLTFPKLDDKKLIYTFHYYEPFIFTHQGAEWTGNKTVLTGLPFPYKRRRMPKMPDSFKGTSSEQDYKKYSTEADDEYLRNRLRDIASYCAQNKMPLVCTEAGVIVNAENKYRKKYLKALTNSFEEFNIKAVLWEFDQRFALENDKVSVMSSIKKWIRRSKRH